jgi:hypothetical protein
MTSSTRYASRRAFASPARHFRENASSDASASSTNGKRLLSADLLPERLAIRNERRASHQNAAIRTSLVGLLLVVMIFAASAYALAAPADEPFAVETPEEIVTVDDLPSA